VIYEKTKTQNKPSRKSLCPEAKVSLALAEKLVLLAAKQLYLHESALSLLAPWLA